eukprot:GHVS01059256.1.p1 GENE.GHVS01059256.1~~GHVS01059256.1.p1  ORF type:complete len:216 (+),score=18.20 GHVS01059256.1:590-1237(+)
MDFILCDVFAEMLEQVGENVAIKDKASYKQFLEERKIRTEALSEDYIYTILLGFHREALKKEKEVTEQKQIKWVVESTNNSQAVLKRGWEQMLKNPVVFYCRIGGKALGPNQDVQFHLLLGDKEFVALKRDEPYPIEAYMRFVLVGSQWKDIKDKAKEINKRRTAKDPNAELLTRLEMWLSYKGQAQPHTRIKTESRKETFDWMDCLRVVNVIFQ